MSQPVQEKNSYPTYSDDFYTGDEFDAGFEDSLEFVEGEEANPPPTQFGAPVQNEFVADATPLSSSQLKSRLSSLLTLVRQSDHFSDSQKESYIKEIAFHLECLKRAQGLDEGSRKSEILRIQTATGLLEGRALSLNGETPAAEAGKEKEEKSFESVKAQVEKFYSKGWITEELYTKLIAKLDRVEECLSDEDLKEAGEALLLEVAESVDQIKAMYVTEGEAVDSLEGEEAETKNGTLKALLQMTGRSEEQALSAFKAAFPSEGISTAKDLANAIKNETAPFTAPPSAGVIKFLKALDAEFAQSVAACKPWKHDILGPNLQKGAERLNILLNTLYGDDHIIHVTQTGTNNGYQDWRQLNEITFDGTSYSFTKESKGQSDQITWEVLDSAGKPVPGGASGGGGGFPHGPDVPGLPGPGDEIVNGAKGFAEGAVDKGKDFIEGIF